jgi:predicted metalloprotease with PDZ domain
MAHANFSSILGYAPDRQRAPARLEIRPAPDWRVACSLKPAEGPANVYVADGFDLLADGIFVAGNWAEETFENGGARYRLVFSRKPDLKDRKLIDDVRGIVRESAAVFGETPFTSYMFLTILEPEGGRGGIEHLEGTSMAAALDLFDERDTYRRYLGLVAHEFVHAWNVKRLRPAGLGPFDLTRESFTHNLYVAEGFTTYYGGVAQARSGAITREEYFKSLAESLVTDRDNVGIREKALEDQSWDWWLDSDIPYLSFRTNYSRGSFVAMVLDLEIRAATKGKRTLDGVMRGLYARTARRETGFTDAELREALVRDGAPGMDARLDAMVGTPGPLDVAAALAHAGLEVVPDTASPAVPFFGWRSATTGKDFPAVDWVEPGSPAAKAGLQSRDLLVALGGRRLSGENLAKEAGRAGSGKVVSVSYFRDGTLRQVDVTPGPAVPPKLIVRERKDATAEQKALLAAWLGAPK